RSSIGGSSDPVSGRSYRSHPAANQASPPSIIEGSRVGRQLSIDGPRASHVIVLTLLLQYGPSRRRGQGWSLPGSPVGRVDVESGRHRGGQRQGGRDLEPALPLRVLS